MCVCNHVLNSKKNKDIVTKFHTVTNGCTIWTLTKCLEKKLDVNYTRMLYFILNKSRKQHPTKQQLYGHKFISDILLWTPTYRHASVGQPVKTYIHQLCADTGYCLEDLSRAMVDGENGETELRETTLSIP